MSRRRYTVCLGLLMTGCSATAVAQQSDGYSYAGGQYPVSQSPVYSQQPQPQNNQDSPIIHPAGVHRPVAQSDQEASMQQCASCNQNVKSAKKPSSCAVSYYRNARWPMPFRAQDVTAVTSFFEIQRENGWRMHNTVGHAMFDPRTNCLTQAGKNHILSILRDNPVERRAVFVLQGQNQQQTATRIQSTELAISEVLPVGDLPAVYVTDRDAPGSSGAYQNSIMQAMKASIPAPRLTSSANNSSGGGTGSSSSGSGSTP